MKNYFIKKIISGILITIIVLSSFGFAIPPKARATGVLTLDIANLAQNVINVVNTSATSYSTYSIQFKEYVLDPIASGLAKAIIRQLTSSVVNWINSGFEGSPSFMTNPGAFFLDMADQITGDFLSKYGGPLTDLCSPFSIDIRIALSFKYHPRIQQRYACTLGTIITNSKNAISGASINGFTAGDFRQGGWPAFVSLTTEPQNNIYGAYLTAESELSIRVANAQIQQKDELNQGKGFLSWRDTACKSRIKKNNEAVKNIYAERTADYNTTVNNINNGVNVSIPVSEKINGENSRLTLQDVNDCPIQTPGSVIVSSLEANVNGPLHELQLADELNEIVNALFAQLATQILSKGLGAVSGSSPSDSSSYIYQIQQEANTNTTQLDPLRNEFIKNVETYINNTLQYKNNKDRSLNLMLDVKNDYEAVKACYTNKIVSTQPPLTPAQIAQAQAKVSETDATITTSVTPAASDLLTKATEADGRYKTLNDLKNRALLAKTVNDLNIPSQQYAQMVQSQTLTGAKDIADSQLELENTTNQTSSLKQDAQRKLQECQIFPNTVGIRGY